MHGFRADATLAAIFLALGLAPALAQSGGPIQLNPGQFNQGLSRPSRDLLSTPVDDASPSDQAAPKGIRAVTLAPIDPSWVGILGPADAALPRSMWANAPRSFVAQALPLLQPTSAASLQDLARRLLLSEAVAPEGSDPRNAPTLPELRLHALLALGRVDGVSLIDVLPHLNASERFDRDAVELRIAANDLAGACSTVQQGIARYRNDWWTRAVMACQALTGAYDEAALGLSALRDQKTGRDPVFEALIETILGHRQKLDKLPDPTPMRMALLAAAKLPLPADALATAGPSALLVWAMSDKVPVVQRLAAGERATMLGALPPAGLGLLYGAVDSRPEEQGALLKGGKLIDDPRNRAMLFNIARTNNPGAIRVATLAPLLIDARRRGVFMSMARLVAPLVAEIQPAPEYQGFAGDAARVLLAAHDLDHAARWIELANAPELRALAILAYGGVRGAGAISMRDVMTSLAARDTASAPRQTDLLETLLTALGESVNSTDLGLLVQPAHQATLPNGALWLSQQQAAAAGRLGETVLTTLLIATVGERLSAEPTVIARAVSGLKAVGLDSDARALALEAALTAGL
jgi:hypothetical protein